MNQPQASVQQPAPSNNPPATGTLPHWEHLPEERRRELISILATLLSLQMTVHAEAKEAGHDSAS